MLSDWILSHFSFQIELNDDETGTSGWNEHEAQVRLLTRVHCQHDWCCLSLCVCARECIALTRWIWCEPRSFFSPFEPRMFSSSINWTNITMDVTVFSNKISDFMRFSWIFLIWCWLFEYSYAAACNHRMHIFTYCSPNYIWIYIYI